MARVAAQLTNFTAGELSPRLDGRNDLSKYPAGCKTLENIVIYPHGAAARRPGTQFIAEVKTSSAKTRLIPFEFSTTQTYILEFGNQYMRVFKDKSQVLNHLKEKTVFFGDKCEQGGNDHTIAHGADKFHQVNGWKETMFVIGSYYG